MTSADAKGRVFTARRGALGVKNVDHVNEHGLDNRRVNLRPCTNASNQQNTGSRGGTSPFKGVSWHARKGK